VGRKDESSNSFLTSGKEKKKQELERGGIIFEEGVEELYKVKLTQRRVKIYIYYCRGPQSSKGEKKVRA